MAEFAPDQGWESYQNQIRLHPPSIPVSTGPDDGGASVLSLPVAAGPKDSTPAAPVVTELQHASAVAAAPVPLSPSVAAPAADSVAPAFAGMPQVSSVFAESSGAQFVTAAGLPAGGSVFASDASDGVGLGSFASYGWYVVPSLGNDPGFHATADSGDSGAWGYADAGYASDWFFA